MSACWVIWAEGGWEITEARRSLQSCLPSFLLTPFPLWSRSWNLEFSSPGASHQTLERHSLSSSLLQWRPSCDRYRVLYLGWGKEFIDTKTIGINSPKGVPPSVLSLDHTPFYPVILLYNYLLFFIRFSIKIQLSLVLWAFIPEGRYDMWSFH